MRGGFLVLVIIIVAGLAIGAGAGAALGWLFPIRAPQAGPAALNPMWQSDYILMTAQAYGLDGDLATAKQRLKELVGPSSQPLQPEAEDQIMGAMVARRGLEAIQEGLRPEDVGRLARLAAALGTRPPELEPYLAR